MSDIIVNTYNLKQYAQRLGYVNSRIVNLDWRLKSLYSQIGLLGLFNLIQADALTGFSWRILQCQSYLNQTAADFEDTENNLLQFDPTNFTLPKASSAWQNYIQSQSGLWNSHLKNVQRVFRGGLGAEVIGYGAVDTALSLMSSNGWKAFWDGSLKYSDRGSVWSRSSEDGESFFDILTGQFSVSAKPKYGSYKDKKILGDKDHLNINVDQTKIRDASKQKNSDEQWYKDPKATILEGKVEAKAEGSVLDGRVGGSNDWAEGSIEGEFLTGEVHASAAAGLYMYTKDKDGKTKKIFSPGVSAEVGASVAVVQVEAEGRIGLGEDKNMLGVYGNVDAKALSAEAKAKVSANRNEVYAGASAEADLVKLSATGGVSVLGTDLGVSGSLKVGVGAHCEVGYTDGKFKVDIGAAVGVGFDLGFEVDVSGTVDAVCDFAASAWDGAKSTVSDVWHWLFG